MRTHPSRIPLATLLLAGLLAASPVLAAGEPVAAGRDSLPSLDDLAGPPSTRFT